MPQMVSKLQHRYSGRVLSQGEAFECEGRHVQGLIALGRAVLRDLQDGAPAEYKTRELKPARRRGRPRKGA